MRGSQQALGTQPAHAVARGGKFLQVNDAGELCQPTGTECQKEGHRVQVRGRRAENLGTFGVREGGPTPG